MKLKKILLFVLSLFVVAGCGGKGGNSSSSSGKFVWPAKYKWVTPEDPTEYLEYSENYIEAFYYYFELNYILSAEKDQFVADYWSYRTYMPELFDLIIDFCDEIYFPIAYDINWFWHVTYDLEAMDLIDPSDVFQSDEGFEDLADYDELVLVKFDGTVYVYYDVPTPEGINHEEIADTGFLVIGEKNGVRGIVGEYLPFFSFMVDELSTYINS